MDEPRDIFHANGLRRTRQRDVIYGALRDTASHPTAEELFQTLRRDDPGLSLATVYNALDAFTRCGLVRRIASSPGACRYDADLSPHVHIVHHDGRVEDAPAEVGRKLLGRLSGEAVRELERLTGVPIDHVSVQVIARAQSDDGPCAEPTGAA